MPHDVLWCDRFRLREATETSNRSRHRLDQVQPGDQPTIQPAAEAARQAPDPRQAGQVRQPCVTEAAAQGEEQRHDAGDQWQPRRVHAGQWSDGADQ